MRARSGAGAAALGSGSPDLALLRVSPHCPHPQGLCAFSPKQRAEINRTQRAGPRLHPGSARGPPPPRSFSDGGKLISKILMKHFVNFVIL